MREHLTFLLAAPMASFGGLAGHERRGSETVPLRSAVLGMLGAALGVDRMDAAGQKALRTYRVAVQAFLASKPLRDFHVAETAPTASAKRPNSRQHALRMAGRDVNTILTTRDYRCDVLVGVAIWGEGRWTLAQIARRLERPKFMLYLGRKSCPLASPLNPRIAGYPSPVEALAGIEIPRWLHFRDLGNKDRSRFLVFSDPVEGREPPPRTASMPAEPFNRRTWEFGECEIWPLRGDQVQSDIAE